nr:tetratricopeptide repeat protein [Litorivivens lipolytica]
MKKWWADNGKSTVLGIVVAVAAVFGWQGWQKQQEGKLAEASASYQSLLEADSAAETDSSKVTTAQHLAETLKADYPGTTYAIFGAMYKAKYAAQINKWEEAEAELRWVLDQKPNDPLLLQAKVRLAHVLLAQKRYEDAQNILAGSELGSYAALIAETRGDILMAQGDKAGALAAYEQAKTELAALENASQNPLLEMKINDLQSAQDGAAEE